MTTTQPATPKPVVSCVCGYGPTTPSDLDEHIIAASTAGDPDDHALAH